MKHRRLWIVFGAGAAAMFWASGVVAQPPAGSKTITETDCSAAKLGGSVPASAIGEPVSGVTLSEPRWNAAAKSGGPYCTVNGSIALRVPLTVIKAKCAPHLKRGQPAHRTELMNRDDHAIVSVFGTEFRGLVQYYLLAGDVWRLNRLRWVMETSMLKTLAAKHRSSVSKMARKYKAKLDTPHGPRTCLQASVERTGRNPLTATFGGIPLKRQRNAVLTDRNPPPTTIIRRTELLERLRTGRCEMCQYTGEVEVHHVGKLAHLGKPGKPQPPWAALMTQRRRKTLVTCTACHEAIHTRQPTATLTQ